ncbi:MAG: fibronectin type III domain-containing protein, partial [bacterium]|nr:fibronectin type III domain-containing protein [bacterium]
GEKVQDVSDTAGIAIMKFGSQFVTEPTEISNVIAVAISPTSVKVSWTTNHPANGKVNWGYEDGVYTFEDQTDKRTTQHEFVLTNLKPNSEYHYEVMSHNKNYVYDANRKFTTPAE